MSLRSSGLISQLQKLGLTTGEAMAYLAVLKLGAPTALQIAREAQLQRTETYHLMSSLASKGLVQQTIDKPRRYQGSNPQDAIPKLAQNIVQQLKTVPAAAEELAAKLTSMLVTPAWENRPEVRVISGARGVEANFANLIASADREVWMMAGGQQISAASGRFIAQALKTISARRLKARLITELDMEIAKHLGKRPGPVEIRHCQHVPTHLYGIDDRAVSVGLTSSRARRSSPISEIFLSHPECVSAIRSFFEAFWEQAVPMSVWVATKEHDREANRPRSVLWGREQLYASVADWPLKARERLLDYSPSEYGPERVSRKMGDRYLEARNRGVRIQSLCHVSTTNLAAVKELCRYSEVRHTEASPGIGFSVLDESDAVIHYVQADTPEIRSPTDISIYVTDRDGIRRLDEMFKLLWENAIPAEIKIRELSGDK